MHIDERVIFIHNPRAAGTSVRRALLHGLDPNQHIPYPGNIAGPTWQNTKHSFAGMARERLSAKAWDSRFKFAIVRNPFDRLVSLHGLFLRPTEPERQALVIAAKAPRQALRKYDEAWPMKMNKIISALNRPELISINTPKNAKKRFIIYAFGLDFKTWLMEFCDEYLWSACRYLAEDRPLTRIQQSEWFDGLDRVFKFEQIDELYDWLTDMGYALPVIENQTERRPWEQYFDAESYDFAAAIFADDIRRFDY